MVADEPGEEGVLEGDCAGAEAVVGGGEDVACLLVAAVTAEVEIAAIGVAAAAV